MVYRDGETRTRTGDTTIVVVLGHGPKGSCSRNRAGYREDITFRAPGRHPISGDYTGHDEVTGFFQALGERSNGTFSIDVHDALDNGDDTVVALVTFNGQRDGHELVMPGVHIWRFKEGLATSHETFVADDHEWDNFGHRLAKEGVEHRGSAPMAAVAASACSRYSSYGWARLIDSQ